MTLISAPAGSGKTMLVSTWLDGGSDVAWVGVERDETDPIRFWAAVMDALRASGAVAGDDPLATLTPAPAGGQDEFLARLLDGLDRLPRELTLVVDDLHELRSPAAIQGLEQLLGAAPIQLRTIVISRRDPKLALHRLRLAGDLRELRAADLHFTADEAGELLAGAGVDVAASDVSRLHERTEGWAAGLRLAALSLARHDAPARFVAEFSGSERTVADYLLDEVLASQPPEVRSLLLRTCILERVNGPLADLVTGRGDGARLLHELEEANAFVVALDVARTWFRYHHLLADLLRLELQSEAPETVVELHRLVAGWHAEHGHAVEAIRHAAHGRDWELAGELLGRHWVHLLLDGEDQTLGALLAMLPAGRIDGDAELATIAAADRLAERRWAEADARIATARTALPALPEARRHRAETALASVQLLRARRIGDLADSLEDATALLHGDGAPAGAELEAFALLNLGITESWTLRLAEAERHCEAGLALARRLQRPYLELGCLTTLGTVGNLTRRLDAAEAHLREAIAIAERLGWSALPMVGVANVNLAAVTLQRGRLEEAEEFLRRAGPILAEAPEPAASVGLCHCRGMLALALDEYAGAAGAFQEGERISDALRVPHFLAGSLRQWRLRALIRLGDLEPARAALAEATNEAALVQPGRAAAARGRRRGGRDRSARAGARRIGVRVPSQPGDRGAAARRARAHAPGRRPRGGGAQRRARAGPGGEGGAQVDLAGGRRRARPAGRPPGPPHQARRVRPRARRPARRRRGRAARARRAAQRARADRPALPPDQPVGGRDRQRAVPLRQHGQDLHAQALREARRAHARRGGRARPLARAAGAVPPRVTRTFSAGARPTGRRASPPPA